MAIRDPGLRVLGDSRWVKDSKAFLPGPLVLAGLFLRFSDLFVASACPATAHLRREWRQACVFLSFLSGIPASARIPQSRNDHMRRFRTTPCSEVSVKLIFGMVPLVPHAWFRFLSCKSERGSNNYQTLIRWPTETMSPSPFSLKHDAITHGTWRAKNFAIGRSEASRWRTAACAVLGRIVHRRRIDLGQCPVEPSSWSWGR